MRISAVIWTSRISEALGRGERRMSFLGFLVGQWSPCLG
jgi:hypothetical protein